jgi:hypothetical protein
MIVLLLVLVIGGYAVESLQVPTWAYVMMVIGAGWRAAHQLQARTAQQQTEAREAAESRRDDEISAQCERNGGHEWPPGHIECCPGCRCPCHERYSRYSDFMLRKMGG